MIDKLIEKYKEIVIASNEMVKEQRQQRFPDEITIRSEITRFCVYETVIQDLEELKQSILNDDDLSINNEIGEIIRINTLIGVDKDE